MSLNLQSVSSLRNSIRKDYLADQQLQQYRENESSRDYPRLRSLSKVNENSRERDGLVMTDTLTQRQVLTCCKNLSNKNHFNGQANRGTVSSNPYYYSNVLISKLALSQILSHSIAGGDIEIMGLLLGTVIKDQFVITRTFALPVEGTETRVNAQSESYEYMVQYIDEMLDTYKSSKETHDRNENEKVVGWYHSHPGYDCWLSSIDMMTQDLNQSFQDPYVALVLDPKKSLEDDKICIGAFRTFKEGQARSATNGKYNDMNSSSDALSFYPLTLNQFDSELNEALNDLKLSYKFDTLNFSRDVTPLMQKLIESMTNLKNINEIQAVNELGEMASAANPNIPSSEQEQLRNTEDTSQPQHGANRSPSLMSLNSANNMSDVDMIHSEIDMDVESIGSSVHTSLEAPYQHRPLLLHSMNTFNASFDTTRDSGTPHQHRSSTGSLSQLPNVISNNQSQSSRVLIRRNSSMSTVHVDKIAVAIEKEHEYAAYNDIKKQLLRLKMQEYKDLRFYRDAFFL